MTGPHTSATSPAGAGRIAFLGPEGTFSEQALLSQPDYAAMELVACESIPDVLHAVSSGEVEVALGDPVTLIGPATHVADVEVAGSGTA